MIHEHDIKEIGIKSVKMHSKLYLILGWKRTETVTGKGKSKKKRYKVDKNFIQMKRLHPASSIVTTNWPLKVYDENENLRIDPIDCLNSMLDEEWQDSMLELMPSFYKKGNTWRTMSYRYAEMNHVTIVKDRIMKTTIGNRRVGYKAVEKKAYNSVKTVRDFIDKFDKALNLNLKNYINL